MDEVRFMLWSAGKIEDEDLSTDEISWLQEAVFNALQQKVQPLRAPALAQ